MRVLKDDIAEIVEFTKWPSGHLVYIRYITMFGANLNSEYRKTKENPFSSWIDCNTEVKMCNLLYQMITSDQPSTNEKDRIRP
jgi:hypothetical protein